MADVNEVVVNENGTVEGSDSTSLTTGEKVVLGVTLTGVGALGWVIGTYVIAPLIKKVTSIGSDKESKKTDKETKTKKGGKNQVPYDEDGDYREVRDDED